MRPLAALAAATALALTLGSCSEDKPLPLVPDDLAERRQGFVELEKKLATLEEADASVAHTILDHDDYRIRARAARRLGSLGERAAPSVPDLVVLLGDVEREVRVEAAMALGAIGDLAAVEPLVRAMAHHDRKTRLFAWKALRRMGPPAIPLLVSHLGGDSPFKRLRYKDEAGQKHGVWEEMRNRMSGLDKEAAPQLIEALESEDVWVLRNVVRVLGGMEKRAKEAVPELVRLLESSPDKTTRLHSAKALGSIGDVAPEVVPALTEATQDPAKRVAGEAKKALKALKKKTEKARRKETKKRIDEGKMRDLEKTKAAARTKEKKPLPARNKELPAVKLRDKDAD